jgi:death-on-curing protein
MIGRQLTSDTEVNRYLRLNDAVAMHREMLHRLSRAPEALRDENVLDSAMIRPRMAAHYENADIVRQATLLAVAVSQAQSFVDGNKRTAYASLDVFLRLNGRMYTGEPIDLAQQLEAVASRDDSLDAATDRFEAWLRERIGPRSSADP